MIRRSLSLKEWREISTYFHLEPTPEAAANLFGVPIEEFYADKSAIALDPTGIDRWNMLVLLRRAVDAASVTPTTRDIEHYMPTGDSVVRLVCAEVEESQRGAYTQFLTLLDCVAPELCDALRRLLHGKRVAYVPDPTQDSELIMGARDVRGDVRQGIAEQEALAAAGETHARFPRQPPLRVHDPIGWGTSWDTMRGGMVSREPISSEQSKRRRTADDEPVSLSVGDSLRERLKTLFGDDTPDVEDVTGEE